MIKNEVSSKYAALEAALMIDCEKCSGLCCVALYCMKTDGFPANKEAGVPCKQLAPDFRCAIHAKLASKGMRGCLGYDCFGAGQKVTQRCYPNHDWKSNPEKADELFQVFRIVFQLHQMQWYLLQAHALIGEDPQKAKIEALISENEQMTACVPDEMLGIDIESYRIKVNQVLRQISEKIAVEAPDRKHSKDCLGKSMKGTNLNGLDFSMRLMIAADLEGCSLRGTNFLGADLRDANIKNTDLSASVFLTQMQINSAKGNLNTKLPCNLSRPFNWTELTRCAQQE